VVLLGFAGLAVDVGLLWTTKRQMQTAADAAAIAGAIASRNAQSQPGLNYQAAAKDLSSFNGFTDGQQGVTVAVNNPPVNGPRAADASFVEVILTNPRPTYFMRALGPASVSVSARAVASSANSRYCIYALDPTVSGAIHTDGGNVLTSNCGVLANSNSPTAVTSSGNISAPLVGIVGSYSGTITVPGGNVQTHIAPVPDPLAYVTAPAVGSCPNPNPTFNNYSISSGLVTLNPGTYCGIGGNPAIKISGSANVTLSPGTYVLNGGGMSVTGTATLTGTGVTIYNTGTAATYGPIFTQDNVTITLRAPTTGPLAGILFFQDRTIHFPTSPNIIGVGNLGLLEGALYFPTTDLVLSSGQNNNAAYTILVAKTLNLAVNTFRVASDYSSLTNGSPIKVTVLYE
jgi:hypothetical protein